MKPRLIDMLLPLSAVISHTILFSHFTQFFLHYPALLGFSGTAEMVLMHHGMESLIQQLKLESIKIDINNFVVVRTVVDALKRNGPEIAR